MDRQNLTLLTDLYELTMMQGYFKNKDRNETVIFDAFYRNNPCDGGFAIMAGVEQLIRYIEELHFEKEDIDYLAGLGIFNKDFLDYLADFQFTGDIYTIPEGTVVFPREPLVKVIAPIMQAQFVETAILNIINHQSLIDQGGAGMLRSAGRWRDGIWTAPRARAGCGHLRRKSGCHRRLCGYLQRALRAVV